MYIAKRGQNRAINPAIWRGIWEISWGVKSGRLDGEDRLMGRGRGCHAEARMKGVGSRLRRWSSTLIIVTALDSRPVPHPYLPSQQCPKK